MKEFGFPKAEHLCLRKDIEALFSPGTRSLSAFPLRLIYRPAEPARRPAVRVLLAVPKRRLRHAIDRNRAKRQLREAYRHHKHRLLTALPEGQTLNIGFLWQSNAPVPSTEVTAKVINLLQRAAEQIRGANPNMSMPVNSSTPSTDHPTATPSQ